MTKADWIYVGCKLIGIGFGISGLMSLVYQLVALLVQTVMDADTSMGIASYQFRVDGLSYVYSIGYLIVGYMLVVKTNACVRILTRDDELQ